MAVLCKPDNKHEKDITGIFDEKVVGICLEENGWIRLWTSWRRN